MGSNSDVVITLMDAYTQKDFDAIEALFTDDAVYHNIPMTPLNGKAEAMQVIRAMQAQIVDWEVLNIAENGNVVLTERVDKFVMADGKAVSLPVMDTMEL